MDLEKLRKNKEMNEAISSNNCVSMAAQYRFRGNHGDQVCSYDSKVSVMQATGKQTKEESKCLEQ